MTVMHYYHRGRADADGIGRLESFLCASFPHVAHATPGEGGMARYVALMRATMRLGHPSHALDLLSVVPGVDVVTVADMIPWAHPGFLAMVPRELRRWWWLLRLSFHPGLSMARRVIAISEVAAAELRTLGYRCDAVVHPVIAPALLAAIRCAHEVRARRGVLLVGSNDARKRWGRAVEVASVLGEPVTWVGAQFPGHPADYERGVLWRARDLGVRVERLTGVSDARLAALYREHRVLLCPSLWEGFCLPVVEALASGLPVVALNGDGGDRWAARIFRGVVPTADDASEVRYLMDYNVAAAFEEVRGALGVTDYARHIAAHRDIYRSVGWDG